MANLVPSPMYQALSDLYATVQPDCPTIAGALSKADRQMAGGNGDVWVGPAARQWESILSGHSADLSRQANAFEQEVHSALARQPQQVTPERARMENLILSGGLG
jgi:hypothetical protein